jgi:acetyltransferase-like isoleucine patch superfamily enzyme
MIKLSFANINYIVKKIISHLFKKNFGVVLIGQGCKISNSALINAELNCIIEIGDFTEILHGCLLMTYGGSIKIGSYCSINPYTIIYGHGSGTIIGNNVMIAGHCMVIPANHNFSRIDIPINQQGIHSNGIIIEDDVWIGAGCQILDGITIGKGSIIAAGSVLNKSTNPYSVMAGIPAKLIKTRFV